MTAPPTAVLVHGLWHGAWCWEPVIARLRALCIPAIAPDLPMRSLTEDTAVLSDLLDEVVGDSVLVGHSYGGAVITAAGNHPGVARLVYLAAFLLDAGESVSRVAPGHVVAPTRLAAALRVSADGQDVSIDPDLAVGLLYNRTPVAIAAAALGRLRPVSRAVFGERPARTAWRDVPSTYVVCTDDRTVAPELQRVMARRAGETYEWDSDHSPNLSRPDEVAELLAVRAS